MFALKVVKSVLITLRCTCILIFPLDFHDMVVLIILLLLFYFDQYVSIFYH